MMSRASMMIAKGGGDVVGGGVGEGVGGGDGRLVIVGEGGEAEAVEQAQMVVGGERVFEVDVVLEVGGREYAMVGREYAMVRVCSDDGDGGR